MSENGWTRGTWSVGSEGGEFWVVSHDEHGTPILIAEGLEPADANLIAASPALAEALEDLLALPIAEDELKTLDYGIGTATRNAAWLRARAALSLAKHGST